MQFSSLPTPRADDLVSLARLAGDELAHVDGGALLRVLQLAPGRQALSWCPLDGRHPLEVLMGFVAPPDWRAVGVSTTGRAHTALRSDEVRVTLLVDRAAATASVVHRDEGDEVLPGRPEGAVPDACRRALALPTSPPPATSLALWTASWLDRVVAVASGRDPGDQPLSWPAVARLHPAGTGRTDPVSLALATRALAEAWPWPRLRAEPAVADVVGPLPSASVAAWMDDGMWARWVTEGLPSLADLLASTRALLPPAVADAVEIVVSAGGDVLEAGPWWSGPEPEAGA